MAEKLQKAIYLLKDENGQVRYVGLAANPDDRLKRHLRECRVGNTHRKAWIRSMLERGHSPTMEVVEWTDNWNFAERYFRKVMQKMGFFAYRFRGTPREAKMRHAQKCLRAAREWWNKQGALDVFEFRMMLFEEQGK